jgi:hypothetical protein
VSNLGGFSLGVSLKKKTTFLAYFTKKCLSFSVRQLRGKKMHTFLVEMDLKTSLVAKVGV